MTELAQPLVGRDRELELLGQLLEETCAGDPRFRVRHGRARDRQDLPARSSSSARPSERGCLALRGSAAEFERELPFGLVVDALDEYLESLDPREFNRLAAEDLRRARRGCSRRCSSLDPGTDQPTTAAERFRAHRAVRELIERLAVTQPLVLAAR